MSHPGAEESLELLLRKLLLGEELVNTEFHLFSVRSSSSGRITKPRVVCANNDLLAKNSKYFTDLLSSDIDPSDSSLRELTDDNDVPGECHIDDYGYGSDSDLEECDDHVFETSEAQSRTLFSPSSNDGAESDSSDGKDLFDDKSDSDASDAFFMSSEHSSMDNQLPERKDTANENPVKEIQNNNETLVIPSIRHPRSSRNRHVLVKDTAFQTWYTLLNYLSTGKVGFLPLRSAASSGRPKCSSTANSLDKPKCSAKSMYRLACKVGLDNLRDQALAHIRSNLTEHNILKEISCSLVARHRQLLEMELDVLYSRIASPSVIAGFPAFVQRIINKELPHGAYILLDIHRRFLQDLHPLSSKSTSPLPQSPFPEPRDPSFNSLSFNPSLGPYPVDASATEARPIEAKTYHVESKEYSESIEGEAYPVENPPTEVTVEVATAPEAYSLEASGWGCSTPTTLVVLEKEDVCKDAEVEEEEECLTSFTKGKKGGGGLRKGKGRKK